VIIRQERGQDMKEFLAKLPINTPGFLHQDARTGLSLWWAESDAQPDIGDGETIAVCINSPQND
jgi:hypothetical protein